MVFWALFLENTGTFLLVLRQRTDMDLITFCKSQYVQYVKEVVTDGKFNKLELGSDSS